MDDNGGGKSEEIIKYGRVTIVRRCRKIGLNWKEL